MTTNRDVAYEIMTSQFGPYSHQAVSDGPKWSERLEIITQALQKARVEQKARDVSIIRTYIGETSASPNVEVIIKTIEES